MKTDNKISSIFSVEKRKNLSDQLSEIQQKIQILESEKELASKKLKNLIPVDKPDEPEDEYLSGWIMIFASIIVGIIFLFHCIIWCLKRLFDISWNTWGWTVTAFCWGIGISIVGVIIFKGIHLIQMQKYETKKVKYDDFVVTKKTLKDKISELTQKINSLKTGEDNIKSRYVESIIKDYRNILGIPIDDYAIAYEECKDVEKMMLELEELLQELKECTDIQGKQTLKKKIVNEKLCIFYLWSIKGETVNTYPIFKNQFKQAQHSHSWEMLREEIKDELANLHWNKLKDYTALLNDNKMTPFIKDLEEIAQFDTKGLFGMEDVDALAEKTKMLQRLFKAAKVEYKELAELNHNITYLLEFVRVLAYRNIYLSAELLNYIRDNAGGKSLTTEKDILDIKVDFKKINSSMAKLKMDVVENISNTVASFIDKGGELLKSKEIVNFIGKNPKTSAALGVIALLGSTIINIAEERNAKVENNLKIQKAAIENIQKMIDNYTNGQSALLRAIEIIKAISNANNGFLQIYEPLRYQVYDKKDVESLTLTDIQQLVLATNEYNKISKAKL